MTKLRTFSGRKIDIATFTEKDIDLMDIAISLSRQRRYAGHTALPWTVGQHTLLGVAASDAIGLPDEISMLYFVHDFEETWVQDVILSIKSNYTMSSYDEVSRKITNIVHKFFKLDGYGKLIENRNMVKALDQAMYHFEAAQMFPGYITPDGSFDTTIFNTLTLEYIAKLEKVGFHIPIEFAEKPDTEIAQSLFEFANVIYTENTYKITISDQPDE